MSMEPKKGLERGAAEAVVGEDPRDRMGWKS